MDERQVDFQWGESVFAVNRRAMRSVRPEVESPWPGSSQMQDFSKKGGEQNAQNQSKRGLSTK